MFDLIMDYNEAKKVIDENGYEGFVKLLEEKFNKKFFSCSTYWYYDSKYICKLKGKNGDVIIGWKGIHDAD